MGDRLGRPAQGRVLDFLEQILVYTEPYEDDVDADQPGVAARMHTRLALIGVEVGGSVHIALLLGPDLARLPCTCWAVARCITRG